MAYPQPNSNSPALNGQRYFRLNTPLVSPGDIYESEQTGHVFTVGPESDISKINVTYYDDAQTNFVNQQVVSNRAPFAGIIQARPLSNYQPANVPGRILFSSGDIVPDLRAATYYPNSQLMIVPPVMDIIQYFAPPPSSIMPARNDRNYFFHDFPIAAGFTLLLPYYGRVFGFIEVRDPTASGAVLAINGITYGVGATSTQSKVIRAAAAVGAGVNQVIKSSVDGVFDYIQLVWTVAAGLVLPTRVNFSDVPQ